MVLRRVSGRVLGGDLHRVKDRLTFRTWTSCQGVQEVEKEASARRDLLRPLEASGSEDGQKKKGQLSRSGERQRRSEGGRAVSGSRGGEGEKGIEAEGHLRGK